MSTAPVYFAQTVLYVEDDPLNQDLVRAVIRKRPDVRLVVAGLGREALVVAAAERPALILLDLHLPDMTGDELMRALRKQPETAAIPVVLVSGETDPRTPDGPALGVIGRLTKPYDIRELLSLVDGVLQPQG